MLLIEYFFIFSTTVNLTEAQQNRMQEIIAQYERQINNLRAQIYELQNNNDENMDSNDEEEEENGYLYNNHNAEYWYQLYINNLNNNSSNSSGSGSNNYDENSFLLDGHNIYWYKTQYENLEEVFSEEYGGKSALEWKNLYDGLVEQTINDTTVNDNEKSLIVQMRQRLNKVNDKLNSTDVNNILNADEVIRKMQAKEIKLSIGNKVVLNQGEDVYVRVIKDLSNNQYNLTLVDDLGNPRNIKERDGDTEIIVDIPLEDSFVVEKLEINNENNNEFIYSNGENDMNIGENSISLLNIDNDYYVKGNVYARDGKALNNIEINYKLPYINVNGEVTISKIEVSGYNIFMRDVELYTNESKQIDTNGREFVLIYLIMKSSYNRDGRTGAIEVHKTFIQSNTLDPYMFNAGKFYVTSFYSSRLDDDSDFLVYDSAGNVIFNKKLTVSTEEVFTIGDRNDSICYNYPYTYNGYIRYEGGSKLDYVKVSYLDDLVNDSDERDFEGSIKTLNTTSESRYNELKDSITYNGVDEKLIILLYYYEINNSCYIRKIAYNRRDEITYEDALCISNTSNVVYLCGVYGERDGSSNELQMRMKLELFDENGNNIGNYILGGEDKTIEVDKANLN